VRETEVCDCAEVLKRHSPMIARALSLGAFGLGGGPFNSQENVSASNEAAHRMDDARSKPRTVAF
jgi:hypothetical protein